MVHVGTIYSNRKLTKKAIYPATLNLLWTELGSEMSAMKCSECASEEAVVLPTDASDVESEWRCNRCEALYSAKEMER